VVARCQGTIPDILPGGSPLNIEGHVERVQQLTLEDLLRFRRTVAPATIQCVENRKGELARMQPLQGVRGDAGAVGNAEWSGVPLAELLRRAAPRPGARFVWFEGLDAVTLPDRQSVFG